MATFTIELRNVIELEPNIGLDNYPIFDEDYREQLNKKITDHFYMREIAFESIPLFTFFMRRTMNEIMPYFNQLYKSERMVIDPFKTIDIKSVGNVEASNTGTSGATSTAETHSRVVNSETPQVRLSGDQDYASSMQDSNGVTNSSSDASESSNSTSSNDTITSGFQGNQSDLLNQYRDTFLNIDLMVIDQLETLFMQTWNNTDQYTQSDLGVYGYGYFNGWGFGFLRY